MSTVEIIAAVFGLLGSLLLATKGRWAAWGWVAYLISNIGWLAFSYGHGYHYMLAQQIGFTVVSLVGIWVWLICPAIERRWERIVWEATRP